MSPLSNVLMQFFQSENHTPLFEAQRLVNSLEGKSLRFVRHTDDTMRVSVFEERRNFLVLLQRQWEEFVVPAVNSGELANTTVSVMKNILQFLQSLPLMSSSAEFDRVMEAFKNHVEEINAKTLEAGPSEVNISGVVGPVIRNITWDTSNAKVLWMDAAEDEYFYNSLRSLRRAYLFKLCENIESDPLASTLLEGVSALLKENVDLYKQLIETAKSQGIKNLVTSNARHAFASANFTDDQLTALDFLMPLGASKNVSWEGLENLLRANVDKNYKIRCDYLDGVVGVPTGTVYNLLKYDGPLSRANWLSRRGDSNDWLICEGFVDKYMRALRTPSENKDEFFRNLTSESVVSVETQNALPQSAFSHAARDWENIQVAVNAPRPLKVLVTGKSGTGKSALVTSVLANTNRAAVTLDQEKRTEVSVDTIATVRQSIGSMGGPVLVMDLTEDLIKKDGFKGLFTSAVSKRTMGPEVWMVSDLKHIPEEVIGAFDVVVEVHALPLAARKDLANQLFKDSDLADKIAKCCTTPGEIVKLHEWSELSGQTDWGRLSVKALSVQQAALKAGTVSKDLPITLYQPAENKNGFESVVGNNHAVRKAREAILGFKDPQRFEVLNGEAPKGVLLTGDPGTGKTYLVRAMAHEAGVPLLVASSAALATNPSLITAVFTEARRQAPCMLFLDEIDAIGATAENKNGASADPKRQAILNRLLVEIGGIEDLDDVMVIGATHRPYVLDPALVRSGRLSFKINFDLPEREAREELWKFYAKNVQCDNIAWDRVARLSSGMSPADICEAMKVATTDAAVANQKTVKMENLIKAIDTIGWGQTEGERVVAESELYTTAVHECGHALLAWLYQSDIDRISVKPGNGALGYVRYLPDEDKISHSMGDIEARVAIALGGLVAEEVSCPQRSMGAGSDLRKVRQFVSKMYREEGIGSYVGGVDWSTASENLKAKVEEEEQNKIKQIKDKTHNLLNANKALLDMLTKKLIKDREISGAELNEWLSEKGITREVFNAAAAIFQETKTAPPVPVNEISTPPTAVADTVPMAARTP